MNAWPSIQQSIDISVYKIPTDFPESDGTLEWNDTTIVLVEAHAGGHHGIGYTFADAATGHVIQDKLAPLVIGANAMAVQSSWLTMVRSIRNLGRPGIVSMAISALDVALWDLKARLLNILLLGLLGKIREEVAVYGSGGFTSYSLQQLQTQLSGWAADGIRRVKMKIGRRNLRGEVRFDEGSRALYPTDGSNYRQLPIGVVIPRDVNDIVLTVAAARRYGAPILARGGGTSLAGQCCNVAVVMDLSKYMNRIIDLDTFHWSERLIRKKSLPRRDSGKARAPIGK